MTMAHRQGVAAAIPLLSSTTFSIAVATQYTPPVPSIEMERRLRPVDARNNRHGRNISTKVYCLKRDRLLKSWLPLIDTPGPGLIAQSRRHLECLSDQS